MIMLILIWVVVILVNNWPDIVNGIFESCGSLFILTSIIKLYHDKKVRGVSWVHAGFFAGYFGCGDRYL